MNLILPHALQYGAKGWPVFRLSKAKVPLKGSHGHLDATTDPVLIRQWWDVANPPNIGLACGEIVVIDLDGVEALQSPWGNALASATAANGGLPATLGVATRRGAHLYFRSPPGVEIRTRNEPRPKAGAPGVDIKAHGGYVVMPPSTSKGFTYAWIGAPEPAVMPPWLVAWVDSCGGTSRPPAPKPVPVGMPAHLQGRAGARLSERREEATGAELDRLWEALQTIPAHSYDTWYQVGMALHSTGWEAALSLFDDWSALSDKYDPEAVAAKWSSFERTARREVTLGTVYHLAKQNGWQEARPEVIPLEMRAFSQGNINQSPNDRSDKPAGLNGHHLNGTTGPAPQMFVQKDPDNPLIDLNEKFAVIGNLGGKCLVLDWIPSAVDDHIKVPSFQTFKSFSERYGARYIEVPIEKKNGDVELEPKQLGAYWLKWTGRKEYTNIGLEPGADTILPGNILNLWRGLAVAPQPGSWNLMREHIADVLADGDLESAAYILKFAAWCLQHPGDRAEVALVFRGEKGSGKGTFARALKDIFGQHGLHIFSSKHLTGNFNAHLRTCLLLFADEAFWAGDKQGESTLKGLLTEPTMMIEQKGVDAAQWKNRLKVIMAANADWAVPASAMERRFAVFNVSDKRVEDRPYFEAINRELEAGGLAAMAHDLLNLDLKGWHPRAVVKTRALLEQKRASMAPIEEWFCSILEDGVIPGGGAGDTVAVEALHHVFQEGWPQARASREAIGKALRRHGCYRIRGARGNSWRFPPLPELRAKWAKAYGGEWPWENNVDNWQHR